MTSVSPIADTQPPKSLSRSELLARRLRLDAERARVAARAIDAHADTMSDHALATTVSPDVVRLDRARASRVLVDLAAPLAASLAEAVRVGLLFELEARDLDGALAALTLLEARVSSGIADDALPHRAGDLRDLAVALDDLAEDLGA